MRGPSVSELPQGSGRKGCLEYRGVLYHGCGVFPSTLRFFITIAGTRNRDLCADACSTAHLPDFRKRIGAKSMIAGPHDIAKTPRYSKHHGHGEVAEEEGVDIARSATERKVVRIFPKFAVIPKLLRQGSASRPLPKCRAYPPWRSLSKLAQHPDRTHAKVGQHPGRPHPKFVNIVVALTTSMANVCVPPVGQLQCWPTGGRGWMGGMDRTRLE